MPACALHSAGMQINHLDLQVRDVRATSEFFQRYFGLRVQSKPSSPALVILTDPQGFVLVLQRTPAAGPYPEGFHLGFLIDSVEAVRAIHARATADGTPVSDVIVNGRGTMIYLSAPEGYYVEVACHTRRVPRAPMPEPEVLPEA